MLGYDDLLKNSTDVVLEMCAGEFGLKYRKPARMNQGKNARPSTRIKRVHLTATHEKKHNYKQGDKSSINRNTYSTNQA